MADSENSTVTALAGVLVTGQRLRALAAVCDDPALYVRLQDARRWFSEDVETARALGAAGMTDDRLEQDLLRRGLVRQQTVEEFATEAELWLAERLNTGSAPFPVLLRFEGEPHRSRCMRVARYLLRWQTRERVMVFPTFGPPRFEAPRRFEWEWRRVWDVRWREGTWNAECDETEGEWSPWQPCPDFLEDMGAAWPIMAAMTARMERNHDEYKHLDEGGEFTWELKFKTPDRYLTHEGYPLGTVCWYVYVVAHGLRKFICAERPEEAIMAAAEHVILLDLEAETLPKPEKEAAGE
jgi:hypothetical protein